MNEWDRHRGPAWASLKRRWTSTRRLLRQQPLERLPRRRGRTRIRPTEVGGGPGLGGRQAHQGRHFPGWAGHARAGASLPNILCICGVTVVQTMRQRDGDETMALAFGMQCPRQSVSRFLPRFQSPGA